MPNTFYAKLNTGINRLDLIREGGLYFLNSLMIDPITLFIIFSSIFITFINFLNKSKIIFSYITIGIILYLIYILYIGGDFMSGRFFACCVPLALLILVNLIKEYKTSVVFLIIFIFLFLISPFYNIYNLKVDNCPLVYQEINEILSILPNSLMIKGSQKLNNFLVYIEHQKGLSINYLKEIYNLNENISGIILKEGKDNRVLYGNNYYKERVLSKTIKINLFSDFEKNVEIFEKKINFLRNLISSNGFKKIIMYKSEFYPLFLFDIVKYCLCSERNGYNRSDLEELFKIYDVFNYAILSVKLKTLIEINEEFDLLVLNKPFIKNVQLLQLNKIKNVIIILENIRKLNKILKIMKNFDYELVLLKPFDSYPQIFNFDLILFFKRK